MSLEEQILRQAEAPNNYFGEVTFQFRDGKLVLIRKSQTLLPERDNRRGYMRNADVSHDHTS